MIIPCQTFLLTLQEADDFLPQLLASSLDFQILNPSTLGENWEAREINYNFRNWYDKIEILDKILGKNEKGRQIWQKYLGKKIDFKNIKIETKSLEKKLEIVFLYYNYKEILNLLAEIELIKINLGTRKKTDIFFGRGIEKFTTDFVSFTKNIVAKINTQNNITLTEKPMINDIICQDLIQKIPLKNPIKQNLKYLTVSPKEEPKLAELDTELGNNDDENEKYDKNNKDLNQNSAKNHNNWQVLYCPKNLSQDLVIVAQRKNVNLLDFEEIKINLEQEKFTLEKRLKTLGFEPQAELTKSQVKGFEKLRLKLKMEAKLNYYRFQTTKNIPANYKKSQIIISEKTKNTTKSDQIDKNLQKPEENQKPDLSFVIIAFPKNQTQLFFEKIKPFKIAFAQINYENLVFWQNLPNSLSGFIFKLLNRQLLPKILKPKSNIPELPTNHNNQQIILPKSQKSQILAPESNSKDPSFIFLNFLVFNVAITLGNVGTGVYLLILAILLVLRARGLAIFVFLTAILTIFFGLLFGNFAASLITSLFRINLQFLESFQIISFSNSFSKAPINQFFAFNSNWKLAILTLVFFFLIGIFQTFIGQFLLAKSLNEQIKSKTSQNLATKQTWPKLNYMYFFLYISLAFIFGSQFYFNFWLNSSSFQHSFWRVLSPIFALIQFILAFLVSFCLTKYFLLVQFYKPTANLLEPENDNF